MKRKEYTHPQIIVEHMQFCNMVAVSDGSGNTIPVNPDDPIEEQDAKMFGRFSDFEDEDEDY